MLPFPTMLLRLCLALLLGGAIGLEREQHAHAAGLRTNALVALGSALFMLISGYGFTAFLGLPHIQVDPSRIASYVVAGIGFLGGGVIAFSRQQERVRGLTTAAAIWLVAALGLACGAGMIIEAITATALALFVLIGLRWVERRLLPSPALQGYRLHIEAAEGADHPLEAITDLCARQGITPQRLEARTGHAGVQVELICQIPTDAILAQTLSQIQGLPGVQMVQAIRERPTHSRGA